MVRHLYSVFEGWCKGHVPDPLCNSALHRCTRFFINPSQGTPLQELKHSKHGCWNQIFLQHRETALVHLYVHCPNGFYIQEREPAEFQINHIVITLTREEKCGWTGMWNCYLIQEIFRSVRVRSLDNTASGFNHQLEKIRSCLAQRTSIVQVFICCPMAAKYDRFIVCQRIPERIRWRAGVHYLHYFHYNYCWYCHYWICGCAG